MSDDSKVSRFAGRSSLDALGSQANEEICDDLGCFGWLRGIRDRALMVELRKKSGNILAISYGWVERVEFDPSEGITLHAGRQCVRIKGRHLNGPPQASAKLFDGLTRHRVPWIQELPMIDMLASGENSCIVESIDW